MVKRALQKNRMPKEKDPERPGFQLQFLFQDPQYNLIPKSFLSEFAGKIRAEYAAMCLLF